MRIVANLPEWFNGLYVPIGGKFVKNKHIYQCVLGNGRCASKETNESCCFRYMCEGSSTLKCVSTYREDRKVASFILIK